MMLELDTAVAHTIPLFNSLSLLYSLLIFLPLPFLPPSFSFSFYLRRLPVPQLQRYFEVFEL
uniref:Uncharacterized protein n=1 Tax=Anguilla anguilla TaxID=7936 RepID=A0A0E9WI16_ANGAN